MCSLAVALTLLRAVSSGRTVGGTGHWALGAGRWHVLAVHSELVTCNSSLVTPAGILTGIVGQALEVLLIPVFILLNGFFAGAELAIISAGRGRLQERSKAGSRRAQMALRLKDSPDRFLPTVQIGITLVGSASSAIGGMTLVGMLAPNLTPHLGPRAGEAVALFLVVGAISYLTLVIGELAPKNLALRFSERYALLLAWPMSLLEKVFLPLVRILDLSTSAVLAPFGGKATEFDRVSRDELRSIIMEGHRQGIYSATERALLSSAIELINRTVKEATIPRHEVTTARPDARLGELRELVVNSAVPYVVLYDRRSDTVHGLLDWRDIHRAGAEEPALPYSQRVIYVPESAPLPKAIEQLQTARVMAAVVVNEYGEFEGLLPLTTILQRQILHFALPEGTHPGIKTVPDGWLVRGDVPLLVLREQLALPLEDTVFYTTLGGFVLEALGRLPQVGDTFTLYGYRFTVRKMDQRRVAQVELTRAAPPEPPVGPRPQS